MTDTAEYDAGRPYDGHTVDVGYVHVLTEEGGPCRDDCPHPDHRVTSPEVSAR